MRKAKFMVIQHLHAGDDVIENILNYAIGSNYALFDKMMVNNLRTDSFQHMVEDFYATQEPYKCLQHNRRLFHFLLTTNYHKTMDRTLDEGAYALLQLFEELGHQCLLIPHYASVTNPEHYHWHVIVNVKSYITGETMYDRYTTYGALLKHLNQNPYTRWSWMYIKNTRENFLNMI